MSSRRFRQKVRMAQKFGRWVSFVFHVIPAMPAAGRQKSPRDPFGTGIHFRTIIQYGCQLEFIPLEAGLA
jgi:hypothetical protein